MSDPVRLKLKHRGGCSADVLFFEHAPTGQRVSGANFNELFDRVYRFHRDNGLPIPPAIAIDVEDQVAQRLAQKAPDLVEPVGAAPSFTVFPGPGRTASRAWHFDDVKRFVGTMAEWIARGAKKVSQKEADRRAVICAGCPENVDVDCAPCKTNELANLAKKVTEGKTASDAALKVCGVCGCLNKAQIWLPLKVLQNHMPPEMQARLPSHCWKKVVA